MSKPTLLVLAASTYQLRTIQTAKRLGYRVVTTDNVRSNPGHSLADRSYTIDTTDLESVLTIARNERVNGVIAPCTDVAVPTAAYVAEKLNLRGPPYKSALTLCNKKLFRQFLEEHAFPTPESHAFSQSERPSAEYFDQGAWVMKPARSSGAKGVFIVETPAQFEAHVAETLSYDPDGCGVIERFISGVQGTCEGILQRGRISHAFFLDRQTVPPPHAATRGHHVPSLIGADDRAALLDSICRLWSLLGVTDGPFDCDFVVGLDRVYILEMTPRLGGNSISTLLHQASGGFDLVEYAVRQALGESPSPPTSIPLVATALVILGADTAGSLAYNSEERAALEREPWVQSITLDAEPGTPVKAFTNGRHRVGEALVSGENRGDLDEHVAEFLRRLNLRALDE